MKRATRLPRWVWGAAITALVFVVGSLWLLVPIARKREELARGLNLTVELEKLVDETWDALPSPPPPPPPPPPRPGEWRPPPPPRDDGEEGGPGERFAVPRARFGTLVKAAEEAPALREGIEAVIRTFRAIEALPVIHQPPGGGPPRPGPHPGALRTAFSRLRDAARSVKAQTQGRNAVIMAELGMSWDGVRYLLFVTTMLLAGSAGLAWRDGRLRLDADEIRQLGEQRYHEIYRNGPLAFIVWDPSCRVVDWNRRAEELLGWTRAEAEGRDFIELIVPAAERDRVAADVDHLLRVREPIRRVIPMATRSGGELICEWHSSVLRDADGRVVSVISSALDVTERERAEAALRASEVRFRRLSESNLIGILLSTPDGLITEANDAFLAIVGYTRDDLRSGLVRWTDMTPPEHRWPTDRAIAELEATGACTPFEKEYFRKNGTRVPVLLGLASLDRATGSRIGFVLDRSLRREIEARARASHDLVETIRRAQLDYIAAPDIRRVFKSLLEGILGLTRSGFGFIGEAEPAADGRPRLASQTTSDRAGTAAEPRRIDVEDLFARVAATGLPVIDNGTDAGPTPAGSFLGLPFHHGETLVGVVGIAGRPGGYSEADVAYLQPLLTTCSSLVAADRAETRRSQAEAGLQASKEAAEAANSAKDRFLAVLSHELRTPLTPVLVGATAARDDPATPPAMRDLCEMIRRNVELEARLIDDLLDVSRISRGMLRLDPSVVDAHALIREVLAICRDDIEVAGLRVELALEARSRHVEVDPARLQQVVWNLVKNAVKFTPRGGAITLRSRNEPPRDGPARGNGQPADAGRLIVEVSDTGLGLEPAELSRIFVAFEQGESSLRRKSGGLGLGLAISRSVVEGHGGRLSASSPGSDLGATFTIELATVPTPAPASAPPVKPPCPDAAPGRPTGLDILLVEDNQDTLRYLTLLLGQSGHRVRPAASLAEALVAADAGPLDLLLSDIELPDGTGLDLVRHLHAAGLARLPAIAMSGFGSDDDIQLSLDAGFVDHLTKPVDFRRLREVILTAADGAIPVAE
jgi:PAS domain S-box-containing protein